jgi:hypothetical protein
MRLDGKRGFFNREVSGDPNIGKTIGFMRIGATVVVSVAESLPHRSRGPSVLERGIKVSQKVRWQAVL